MITGYNLQDFSRVAMRTPAPLFLSTLRPKFRSTSALSHGPHALLFQQLNRTREETLLLRREVQWAGRDFKYYKSMLEHVEKFAEHAEENAEHHHNNETTTLKVAGVLMTLALCCCAYIEIIHAIHEDENDADKPKLLGVRIGRKTRWTVVGEALNLMPHAQNFITPAFEKLRAAGERFHKRVSQTDAAKRPWHLCQTFQQKIDWAGVNVF